MGTKNVSLIHVVNNISRNNEFFFVDDIRYNTLALCAAKRTFIWAAKKGYLL